MGPDYKNWVPRGMVVALCAGTLLAGVAFAVLGIAGVGVGGTVQIVLAVVLGLALLGLALAALWSVTAYRAFSYNGRRQLSRQVVEGVAAYVTLPAGGTGLDVGCGSGALTIACAKRNPSARMVGIDRWGREYASYGQALCQRNAQAEGVDSVEFCKGDATRLDFPDETFDAVTSNYVYHNIPGVAKQQLLRETLRVLKKGGCFAIHDLMSPVRYGDMAAFADELRREGYERVELVDTTQGQLMEPAEARRLMLTGSTLLVGTK